MKDSYKDPNVKAALTPYHPNAQRSRLPVHFRNEAKPYVRFCQQRNQQTYVQQSRTEAGFERFRTTSSNYFEYDTKVLSVGESNQARRRPRTPRRPPPVTGIRPPHRREADRRVGVRRGSSLRSQSGSTPSRPSERAAADPYGAPAAAGAEPGGSRHRAGADRWLVYATVASPAHHAHCPEMR